MTMKNSATSSTNLRYAENTSNPQQSQELLSTLPNKFKPYSPIQSSKKCLVCCTSCLTETDVGLPFVPTSLEWRVCANRAQAMNGKHFNFWLDAENLTCRMVYAPTRNTVPKTGARSWRWYTRGSLHIKMEAKEKCKQTSTSVEETLRDLQITTGTTP